MARSWHLRMRCCGMDRPTRAAGRGAARWTGLGRLFSGLERRAGDVVRARERGNALRGILSCKRVCDLSHIEVRNGPRVGTEVQTSLYRDSEPLPVAVDDLA